MSQLESICQDPRQRVTVPVLDFDSRQPEEVPRLTQHAGSARARTRVARLTDQGGCLGSILSVGVRETRYRALQQPFQFELALQDLLGLRRRRTSRQLRMGYRVRTQFD